jgi:hypothetical protein
MHTKRIAELCQNANKNKRKAPKMGTSLDFGAGGGTRTLHRFSIAAVKQGFTAMPLTRHWRFYFFGSSSSSTSPLLYWAVLMQRIAPRKVQMTVMVAGI